MGEWSEFDWRDKVPNDGVYIEVGAHADSGELHSPQRIRMQKGDTFPKTTNDKRKWRRIKTNKKR